MYVNYAHDAETSLQEIGRYTLTEWGRSQRDAYLKKIFAMCESLCAMPNKGTLRNDIAEGLRSVPVEHHMIYYFVFDSEIRVANILHQKMDPTQRVK